MTAYKTLLESVSFRYNDRVLKYCDKLFRLFNLNEFWYFKVTNQGHFTYICSLIDFDEYFCSEKLYLHYPTFRDPRNFSNGLILMETVQDESILKAVEIGKGFNLHHSMNIVTKTLDGMEVIGFSSSIASDLQLALMMNELPRFKLFGKKIKEDNPRLFTHLEDQQIDIAMLIGPAFYQKQNPEILELPKKQQFLKEMGYDFGLTRREIEVLQFMVNGLSSSQIGKLLHLSKRTIEHHFERVKLKLGSSSKADLFKAAKELQQIGVIA